MTFSARNLPCVVEHLDAVAAAIGDVDLAVLRSGDAVRRRELLRQRAVDHRLRIEPLGVVRHVAVGAPVAQVLAGGAVEHDDAAVAVAVGDVDLVVRRIHPDARRSAEQVRVGAAAGLLVLAERHQVLAVARELHHAVAVVAADPDEVVVIDEDAVRLARPVGEVGHTSPGPSPAPACPADRIRERAARLCSRCRSAPAWVWRGRGPPRSTVPRRALLR